MSRKKQVMDYQLFKNIIIDANQSGVEFIQLSFYGECLLDSLITEKIKFIYGTIQKARVQIVTNGSLLTSKMVDKLLESGVDTIKISIEGNNSNEFNQIRKNLDYDKVVTNVRNLKRQRDSGKYRTKIEVAGLNLVDFPLNQDYETFWGQYADSVYVRDERVLRSQNRESIISQIMPCYHFFTTLPILADGRYTICPYDWHGSQVYGDINVSSVKQAWYSPRKTLLKLLHLCGLKKTYKMCGHCSVRLNWRKLIQSS